MMGYALAILIAVFALGFIYRGFATTFERLTAVRVVAIGVALAAAELFLW